MKLQKKSNTLLLKFHLPFRGKNSSPFPVVSCSDISVKRSKISKKRRKKKTSNQPDSEIMKEKSTSMASEQIFTLGAGNTRPSTWVNSLLIEIPEERSIWSSLYLLVINACKNRPSLTWI